MKKFRIIATAVFLVSLAVWIGLIKGCSVPQVDEQGNPVTTPTEQTTQQ